MRSLRQRRGGVLNRVVEEFHVHLPEVLILSRLWTVCSKRHSQLQALSPRRRKRPAPRWRCWPNTGPIDAARLR
jgi:hypothetical protein